MSGRLYRGLRGLTVGEEEPDTHSDDDSWNTLEYKEPVHVRVVVCIDGETYHCHPERPALPLRYEIPVARIPPKAPATATLEAKIAIRVALSSGLYQKQRYIMILQQLATSLPNSSFIHYSPREETSLSKTQENPHNQQPRISRNSSRANSNNSPRNHNPSNPFTRRKVLEENVTREFHEDVWHEE